jgi:hypothetical protein
MVKIGTVAFDLVAYTGKLTAPLSRAEKTISSFVSRVTQAYSTVAAFAAPVVGVIALQRAFDRVKQSMEDVSALSHESRRLGIPAEQLSALQYTAKMAGVETEKLTESLKYMMRQGIDVKVIGMAADKLDAMVDPVKRMQLALKLFGRGGAQMIDVLEGGSATLLATMKEARDIGYTLTSQQAYGIERAGDAWDRVKLFKEGFWRQLSASASFYLERLATSILNLAKRSGDLGMAFDRMFAKMASGWDAYLDVVDRLVTNLELMWQFTKATATLGLNKQILKDLDDVIKNIEIIRENPLREQLKYSREKARKQWEAELDAMSKRIGDDKDMAKVDKFKNAPLLRGSQEAFKAIQDAMRGDKDKKIALDALEELKKIRRGVDELGKMRAPALIPAGL